MRIRTAAVLSFLISLSCLAASMQFGPMWQSYMPSALGDARYGSESCFHTVTNMEFGVHLPPGEHQGMTVTMWTRLTTGTGAPLTNTQLCAIMFYTPEKIRSDNPSLAFCDAQGWPTNMLLSGTVSVDPFPFAPYDIQANVSNQYPKGVYTIAGESSNEVTVSVGGAEKTLGPGAFNRNVIAGSGTGCSVTGTGWAKIGVSRTPCAEFFSLDGSSLVSGFTMDQQTMVTNELKFIALRLCLSDTEHKGCADYYDENGLTLAITNTLAMPRHARSLSSDGIYRIQIFGALKQQFAYDNDFFDVRVLPWVLTEAEIDRIRRNGYEEYNRRGIPRWK